jgi:uncharacterized protein
MPGRAIPVIDADSHLLEVPDVWTSRFPSTLREDAPCVDVDDDGNVRWRLGDRWLHPVGAFGQGHTVPPKTWDEIDPACYDASARLQWMDAQGIRAQILYPNLVAFETFAVMDRKPEIQRLIFRAYNDYLVDFASVASDRFGLISALPFWDLDESIAELTRCREIGHHGMLWASASTMALHGLPPTNDPYWDRLYAAAQDLEMSVNFHIATGQTQEGLAALASITDPLEYVKQAVPVGLSNAQAIADILMSAVCEKFPRLAFVSVESGFGYIPYILELMDWQWKTNGGWKKRPDRLFPSEYFRRQVYSMFWFEEGTLGLLDRFPDNVMFETDFPHPTSLTPTPYTENIPAPKSLVDRHVATYDEQLMRKVLYENAARVYRLG